MVELVFVIVIIGILASIAVPRLAATRDDADITKAAATVASVRAALSTERQLRILRGDFTAITSLNAGGGAFSTFSADGNGVSRPVLEGTVGSCKDGDDTDCWNVADAVYTYVMPSGISGDVDFTLANGQFTCDTSDANCKKLTQ